MADTCYYCKKPGDLRPYGPDGALVCFPCATSTPERESTAVAGFSAVLNHAELEADKDRGIVVLTTRGVRVLRRKKDS